MHKHQNSLKTCSVGPAFSSALPRTVCSLRHFKKGVAELETLEEENGDDDQRGKTFCEKKIEQLGLFRLKKKAEGGLKGKEE